MPDIELTPLQNLPAATEINDNDLIYILQEGVSKKAPAQLFRSYATNELSVGTVLPTYETEEDLPEKWLLMDDGTIGNASSEATTRANADTVELFLLLWKNVSNTYAPVSGGRGASAQEDFDANKTIGLTKTLGRALAASGHGENLTNRVLAEFLGAETHVLSVGELAAHTHGATNPNVIDFIGGDEETPTLDSASVGVSNLSSTAIAETGSNEPHNNMQPTTFINLKIKYKS